MAGSARKQPEWVVYRLRRGKHEGIGGGRRRDNLISLEWWELVGVDEEQAHAKAVAYAIGDITHDYVALPERALDEAVNTLAARSGGAYSLANDTDARVGSQE